MSPTADIDAIGSRRQKKKVVEGEYNWLRKKRNVEWQVYVLYVLL